MSTVVSEPLGLGLETAPPPETARLMLLDTYGLVYRAFFALPMLTTTRGEPINAAYGFTQMMTRIVAEEKPTHVVACFDRGLPRARVALYSEYKAHREAMPDDLRSQFALVRRILDVYRIPQLDIEGEEADDVIATLARKAGLARQHTAVVTGDLDLLQIVDERTTVLTTKRGITELGRYDPAAVRARFELDPGQLPDYRGLKGDPSDNLPGIPGVGEKTAIKLIQRAGSLDALLADPTLAGSAKLENLVREHGAIARVCRDVSVVDRDLPLEVPWESATWTPPNTDELYVLYRDLEFKSLLARLPAPKNDVVLERLDEERLTGAYRSFVAATDPPEFVELERALRALADADTLALALRADGEFGASTSAGTGLAFSLAALAQMPVAQAFAAAMASARTCVAHDSKRVATTLIAAGFTPPVFVEDVMVAAHLLNPSRSFEKLDDAASEFLAVRLPDDASACADATLQLVPILLEHLEHRDQLSLYRDVELPLARILAELEVRGLPVDVAALDDLASEVTLAIERLQSEIYAIAGDPFNIGSPQQLGTVLFEKLAIPNGGKTKTGWATGVEVLQPLAREHEIVAKVLEYREVTKLKNTYIDVIPRLVDAHRRLHTQFHQTTTATGRLSSTNPNLQNIPVRTELGRRVRRAFVASSPERVLLAADYSQIELRIMAHLSGDEAMREAFLRGDDIHDVTARGIFALAPDDHATPNQRRIAKSVNFGLLYGMSDFGLAQRLEIGREEARAMTQAYFARFPGVKTWIAHNLEFGREHGYVQTILGRRRYMPDLRARNYALRAAAEREATNAPMQGSAADLMKLAMVAIDARLRERPDLDAQMLLQIHDELVFDVPRAYIDMIASLVTSSMEGALQLTVPLVATVKAGTSLFDVEPLDRESTDA
jgi:DNA polymerase-1